MLGIKFEINSIINHQDNLGKKKGEIRVFWVFVSALFLFFLLFNWNNDMGVLLKMVNTAWPFSSSVYFLLSLFFSLIRLSVNTGNTALHYACQHWSQDWVLALLKHGAYSLIHSLSLSLSPLSILPTIMVVMICLNREHGSALHCTTLHYTA